MYKSFAKELKKYDVIIIDSAGRDSLNEELVEASATGGEIISKLSIELNQTEAKLEESFIKYEEVSEKLESIEAEFQQKLEDLEFKK